MQLKPESRSGSSFLLPSKLTWLTRALLCPGYDKYSPFSHLSVTFHFQGWLIHNFWGQHVPVPQHPHSFQLPLPLPFTERLSIQNNDPILKEKKKKKETTLPRKESISVWCEGRLSLIEAGPGQKLVPGAWQLWWWKAEIWRGSYL